MQMDSSSMNSSILNISISTTDADNAVAYVEDNIVPEIERIEGVADVEMVEQERTSYSRQNGEENISISVTKEQDGNTVSICNQIEELVNEFNADSSLGLTLEIISNSGEDIYDNIMSVVTSLIEGLVSGRAPSSSASPCPFRCWQP